MTVKLREEIIKKIIIMAEKNGKVRKHFYCTGDVHTNVLLVPLTDENVERLRDRRKKFMK